MTLHASVTDPHLPGEEIEAGHGGGRPWAHSRAKGWKGREPAPAPAQLHAQLPASLGLQDSVSPPPSHLHPQRDQRRPRSKHRVKSGFRVCCLGLKLKASFPGGAQCQGGDREASDPPPDSALQSWGPV